MKFIFTFLLFAISFIGTSQDTIKRIDTTVKTQLISPLPVSIYNVLRAQGNTIEVTMYQTSKTFTFPTNKDVSYFLSFLIGKSTVDFNKQNSAYLMFIVNDDFYMDAEVSISEKNSYIIFKKDGIKYYNLINQKGIDFFNQ